MIAAVVILVAWLLGVPPHPTAMVLLAVAYVLYLLPTRVRRIALPVTVLGIALAYPIVWANDQADQDRGCSSSRSSANFPSWTRWSRW